MSFGLNCAALSGNHHCLRAEAPWGWILALAKIMFGFAWMMWLCGEVCEMRVLYLDPNITSLFINELLAAGCKSARYFVYGCFKENC